MRLIIKTYGLQVRRTVQEVFQKHLIVVLGSLFSVVCLSVVSAIIIKELIKPAIDIINDFNAMDDMSAILGSFAFTCSGVVGVIMIIKMVISDNQDDTYLKMLRNYGVSQMKRQSMKFIIDIFYLLSLSYLIIGMIFGPSLLILKQFQWRFILVMSVQTLWSSIFILTMVNLIQIATRFILARWISIGLIGVSLFYGFKYVGLCHPLNLFAYIYQTSHEWYYLAIICSLMLLCWFMLSFKLGDKEPQGTWLHFPWIPNHLLFKQMKETLRMKDFWFNTLLISAIVLSIYWKQAGLLNDEIVLGIIVVLPSMQSIYTFAQLNDSVLLYRNAKVATHSVYLSGLLSVCIIYCVQFLLLLGLIEPLGHIFRSQWGLVLLCCSVFKCVGLVFPLHYQDSRHHQMIISALSLLILPVVLIVVELQKHITITPLIMNLIYFGITSGVNRLEYQVIKRRLL